MGVGGQRLEVFGCTVHLRPERCAGVGIKGGEVCLGVKCVCVWGGGDRRVGRKGEGGQLLRTVLHTISKSLQKSL